MQHHHTLKGTHIVVPFTRTSARPLSNARTAIKAAASTGKEDKEPVVLTSGQDIKARQFNLPSLPFIPKDAKINIGFTKTNELFISRLAMLGFSASIIGEILTGKGALAQLGLETGVPVFEIDGTIAAIIFFNLFVALIPIKGEFEADESELEQRPDGLLQDPSIPLTDWKRVFGVKEFGFTRENELLVGRTAQLGFAASLVGEILTGKGILGQFDYETGLPLNETEPLLLAFVAFTLLAAILKATGFVGEK